MCLSKRNPGNSSVGVSATTGISVLEYVRLGESVCKSDLTELPVCCRLICAVNAVTSVCCTRRGDGDLVSLCDSD